MLWLYVDKADYKAKRNKLHAIPHFPAGSFVVHIRDHLWLGIVCCPIWGSFPVWGSFAVGDHLQCCSAFPLADLCSSVILVPILVKRIDLVVHAHYMHMSYVVPPLSPGLFTSGLNR